MTTRKQSRYATKRKLRLVPLAFSEPCEELLAELRKPGAKEERLNDLRERFARYVARDEGGPLWA